MFSITEMGNKISIGYTTKRTTEKTKEDIIYVPLLNETNNDDVVNGVKRIMNTDSEKKHYENDAFKESIHEENICIKIGKNKATSMFD